MSLSLYTMHKTYSNAPPPQFNICPFPHMQLNRVVDGSEDWMSTAQGPHTYLSLVRQSSSVYIAVCQVQVHLDTQLVKR